MWCVISFDLFSLGWCRWLTTIWMCEHFCWSAHLRDSSVQSCIDLMELQSQPNSTTPAGRAGTPFRPPIRCDRSTSPRDTCTEWGTSFQVDNNARQSRRVVVSGYHQSLIKQKKKTSKWGNKFDSDEKLCSCVKDKWHLEDTHIVLGTADTVSGQWGQCDCSVSLVGRRWMVRWVWRNQGDTQTFEDSEIIVRYISAEAGFSRGSTDVTHPCMQSTSGALRATCVQAFPA